MESFIDFALVELESEAVLATATIQTSEIRRQMYLLLFKAHPASSLVFRLGEAA